MHLQFSGFSNISVKIYTYYVLRMLITFIGVVVVVVIAKRARGN